VKAEVRRLAAIAEGEEVTVEIELL
jgi:hypothetical protein